MSRQVNPGDLAFINDQQFIIQQITPEGIYISSEQEPNDVSLLVPKGDIWQVYMYDVPHTVRFEIDHYSSLPSEIIREIALVLDELEIENFCLISHTFNNAVCNNEHFWKQKYLYDYQWLPEGYSGSWKRLYLQRDVYAFGANNNGQL